jgi:LmbE family N-acetylglucosaminyl deacetylase
MVEALKSRVSDVILYLFALLAKDASEMKGTGPLLVIAPHPDDDILSCGATIARARQAGLTVAVVYVTDGSASSVSASISPAALVAMRALEAEAALDVLGCPAGTARFLNVPDNHAQGNIAGIAEQLRSIIVELKPRRICSPYGIDPHPDHRAVAEAVRLLLQDGSITCELFEYPRFQPISAVSHLFNPAIWSRLRSVQADDLIQLKASALRLHRTQCENITGETEWQTLPAHWVRMFFNNQELFLEKSRT